jgi:hypothetical protein
MIDDGPKRARGRRSDVVRGHVEDARRVSRLRRGSTARPFARSGAGTSCVPLTVKTSRRCTRTMRATRFYRTARWPRGRRTLSRSATAWPVCAAATLVGSGGRGFRTPCTVATVRLRNSTERDFFPSHGSKASHMTAELSNVRLSRGTFDKRAYRARPTRWDPTGVARDSLLLDRARAVILWSREQRGIDLRIKNGFELRERMVSRIGSSSAGSAWLLRARVR